MHTADRKPLPSGFEDFLQEVLPTAEARAALFEALEGVPPTSVRLHPQKGSALFDSLPAVPWCIWGRYLSARPFFAHDPFFWAGAYYVQEAASMFVGYAAERILDFLRRQEARPLTLLDLCAAPGGKSTHLASLLHAGDKLISNEIMPNRIGVLIENLNRWGSEQCIITHDEAASFGAMTEWVDLLVADVPCSGEGMFRKDMEARERWTPKLPLQCAALQKEIIAEVLPALRQGGFLIYSTCTFNKEENEHNLHYFLSEMDMVSVPLQLPDESGITVVEEKTRSGKPLYAYRFFPHQTGGEGFFLSVLQKRGKHGKSYKKAKQKLWTSAGKQHAALKEEYLTESERWQLWQQPHEKDLLMFTPIEWEAAELDLLSQHLNIKQVGVPLGQVLKGKLNPHPYLAYSPVLRWELPAIEVSIEDALQFLRKQPMQSAVVPANKGWYLIRYEGRNLGWVKALGNRYNNYYPNAWQLRS
jgi:16S rRNA C967 or C1407 C5-methylase (RsmB/RsmF family)/NOL1/NOP2/fmu family ribosome biogenesis protein